MHSDLSVSLFSDHIGDPLVLRPLERVLFVLEDLASGFSIKVPIDFGLAAIDSTIPSPALLSECLQVWNCSLA